MPEEQVRAAAAVGGEAIADVERPERRIGAEEQRRGFQKPRRTARHDRTPHFAELERDAGIQAFEQLVVQQLVVLVEYFVVHGYAVIGAESASAAKAIVAEYAIDLALVDLHVRGEDGLSLARHLRERYATIAIVMLTSATTVVDRSVGPERGADDYVPKPFDPRELLTRGKSVLRMHPRQRA